MNTVRLLWIIFLFFPLALLGEELEKIKTVKKLRYAFGVIPALAFDSDLGFKYGAVVNLL